MKVLLTGGSGFLGRYLLATAPKDFSITATHFRKEIAAAQGLFQTIQLDLSDQNALQNCLIQLEPDLVLHAAADADIASCEANPKASSKINCEATTTFANYAADKNKTLCYLSTDLVFDGKNAPYQPTTAVSPVSEYGRQKVRAEQTTLDTDGLVCRLPLMYGLHTDQSRGQLEYMLNQWQAGRNTLLFNDEYRSIAHAERVANGIWLLLTHGKKGAWHLGGPERISRYDFAKLWASQCRAAQKGNTSSNTATNQSFDQLIQPNLQSEHPAAAMRPADVTLDSKRSYDLGFQHPPHLQELRAIWAELSGI